MAGIDSEYWKGRGRWSLEEGCKLVCRVDPNTNTQTEFIRNLDADTRGRPAWVKLLYKARTAIQAGTLQTAAWPIIFTDAPAIIKVLPAVFLAWAQGQGVTIPRALADIASSRYPASIARRESRKLEQYQAWQKAYLELKRHRPSMSDVWYSKQIAKDDIADGRAAETIRKHMKK